VKHQLEKWDRVARETASTAPSSGIRVENGKIIWVSPEKKQIVVYLRKNAEGARRAVDEKGELLPDAAQSDLTAFYSPYAQELDKQFSQKAGLVREFLRQPSNKPIVPGIAHSTFLPPSVSRPAPRSVSKAERSPASPEETDFYCEAVQGGFMPRAKPGRFNGSTFPPLRGRAYEQRELLKGCCGLRQRGSVQLYVDWLEANPLFGFHAAETRLWLLGHFHESSGGLSKGHALFHA
jgi:hypothetical protein